MSIETLLVIGATLVLLSIAASALSTRLGVPLVLFLAIGMLAGSDGPGGIAFDDAAIAQHVGVVALACILFSGGLDTDWRRIRPLLGQGLALANIGVLVSSGLMAVFAHYALGLSWIQGLLLGAIVSSTDAAAVFAVLRTSGVNLRRGLEPLIELESGSNDPIAVFLTAAITALALDPSASLLGFAGEFVQEMLLGAVGGLGLGWLGVQLLRRLRLPQDGLYSVLTLAIGLATYGAVALVHGNGFLAVYVAGLVVGNATVPHKRTVLRFHEGIAWLMQIAMFLTLGLFVFPRQLPAVAGSGLLAAVFLLFVARPLSVLVAVGWLRRSLADVALIAWAGLRGAVPIVLATFPLLAGVPGAPTIFNLVFFIVVVSVVIQGLTIGRVARWLGLNAPEPEEAHETNTFVPEVGLNSRLVEVAVAPGSKLAGQAIMDPWAAGRALVVQVRRGADRLVPNGGTVLHVGDGLMLLTTPEAEPVVRGLVG